MAKDIRISISFLAHRKRKKLEKILGLGATGWLINLWLSTSMNHPKGILDGMTEFDIAIDAGFEGNHEEFVQALVDVGFLEVSNGVYSIHDWEKHQPWVFHSEERSEIARNAANAKWNRLKGKNKNVKSNQDDAQRMRSACETHAERNAPSPSPLPLPTTSGSKTQHSKSERSKKIDHLIEILNKTNGWRRIATPAILKTIDKNLAQDPNWLDNAILAAPQVHRIDDSGWPGGKVRFEWFFQMQNQRRELDPVVYKILDGAYKYKKNRPQSVNPEPLPVKPADPKVVSQAVKEAIKNIGKIQK
jgi:hypothetical protein